MKKNIFATSIINLICLLSVFYIRSQSIQKPNVVIIYMDDMGYADLGCFNSLNNQTPKIDQIAQGGMKFTNFYAGSNICSPSRASLLTGCYPPRAGMPDVLVGNSENGLSYQITTMAEMLKGQGYSTALVGKWHLGHQPGFLPLHHGFDYFYGTPFSHDIKVNGNLPFYKNDQVIENNPDISQLTTRYTDEAVKYIKDHKDSPFFLYVAHNMPHTPLAVSDKYKDKSGFGLYADVMMELDWSVGEIVKELEIDGIDKNTLVIITSDNGPSLKKGIYAGDAGPLREGKTTTFEGGHRVPGIFYMPGTVRSGYTYNGMATQLDIFPTVAYISGSALPNYQIDGTNMWPALTTGASYGRNEFFFYHKDDLEAYRKDDLKLHRPHDYWHSIPDPNNPNSSNLQQVKYNIDWSIYNLFDDVGENNNILDQQEAIRISYDSKMTEFNNGLLLNKFEPETGTLVNIALNKPVTTSSNVSTARIGDYAVDGSLGTRWGSAWQDNQSITIDLGVPYDLSGALIYWESSYATSYNIKVSLDNVNWSTVYTKSNGTGGNEYINMSGTGRYVRLNCLTRSNPMYGFSIYELELYGSVADIPFPDPSETYYIENNEWNRRIGANGGQDPFSGPLSSTGASYEWKISASPTNGYYYIDCIGGGSRPRLRTDNTLNTDMENISATGDWTQWSLTDLGTGWYLLTTLGGDTDFKRLQMTDANTITMRPTSWTGSLAQFKFVKVSQSLNSTSTLATGFNETRTNPISVYSVLGSDRLHVNLGENHAAKLRLYDMTGRLLRTEQLKQTDNSIDIGTLGPSGLLIARVTASSGVSVFKIIVKK